MSCNPDPSKQAQEVIENVRIKSRFIIIYYFNHNPVQQAPYQKHLEMHLDTKLNFQECQ